MEYYYFFVAVFLAYGVVAVLAAVTGHRGQVCMRGVGYTVPAAVERDPELTRRANELVLFWALGGAILSVPPLILFTVAVARNRQPMSLWELAVAALYAVILGGVLTYPLEKIKTLGSVRKM